MLWVVATLVAAAGQTARNAMQSNLTASLGTLGATQVRFLYGFPFALGFLLIYRVIHSPFGNVLKAIRDNEPRAISLGYDADRYKLLAFVLSAMLSGLAGAT